VRVVLRRILPAVLAAGLFFSAPAAHALSSGDLIKQGVQALLDGKTREALELFTRAEKLDPNATKPHYYVARALERLGEADSAKVEYENALRANPKYVEALTGLGSLLRKQGKLEEGTAKLQEAVKYGPKDAQALYALGQAYLKDKRYDEALAVFRKGTLLKQGRELFLDGQALAMEAKGDVKGAEEIFIRARETNPNSLRVRLDLGGFYDRKKIPLLAAPEYGKAAEIDPKNPETHYLYGRALVGMNEFNAGLSAFMRAMEVDSTYAPAYLEAGRLYYRANRGADAAEKFRAYTGLRPEDPEGYLDLGRALAKSRDPNDKREAIVVLEKAIEMKPGMPDVLAALGRLYFEQRDNENALKYYDQYAAIADTLLTAEENMRLGTLYVANQDSAKAVSHLSRAIAMDSTFIKDANFQLGFLFFARRDYPSAMPFFQASVKVDSTFVPALLNLGLCQLQAKDQSAAIETLRRVIVSNPNENRARIWIGQTLAAMDSLPEALEMYQSAIAQDSTSADAFRGAGLVLLLQKNCAEAEGYLEKGTELDPENLPGHIWLGQAYSICGDVSRAKAEFNKAIDIDPTNTEASKGLERIRKFEEQQQARTSGAKQ